MATTLFFLTTFADTHLGTNNAKRAGGASGWSPLGLSTTVGAGVVASDNTATVAGPTVGLEVLSGGIPLEWISPPVSSDVTISGTITANIWAAESNMSANVAINVIIDIIRAASLTAGANDIVNIVQSTRTAEVAVTTRAVNNFTTGMTSGAYTGQTLNRGDRLRIRIVGDDSTANMASGFTFNASYGGATGGADGDTFITFTETFSFESAPSGSQLFLTNVQSGLSGAPALISNFTGADENPLSEGGNWAQLNTFVATSALQRISNSVAGTSANICGSYWTPANFGPDLEAYLTFSTLSTGGGIVVRIQGEGGSNTFDGYRVSASSTSTRIARVDNGILTTLLQPSTTWANGDKLGVRIEGSTLQAWRQASGSSDWNLVATAIDTTYSSAGKVAIYCDGTVVRIDDFYAATDSNLFTQKAWTSRGAGVVSYISDTDAGWVSPLYTQDWYTPPLQAFTLTGLAQANIRALEAAGTTEATFKCEIARVDQDGTNPTVWASWCMSCLANNATELALTERAETVQISGDDLAISNGQRLRIRIYVDDRPSAPLAAGSVTFFYNGTSAAASGDSYVTLAQTVSEFSVVYVPRHPAHDFGSVTNF